MSPKPMVRAVHCDRLASDQDVYAALKRATAPLTVAWQKLKAARRIGIKFNQAWDPERVPYYQGQYRQLVSEKVARATLRLLREETDAEIICSEISVFKHDLSPDPGPTILLLPLLQEFGVQFADGNLPPHQVYPVPGGGTLFQQYLLPAQITDVDAFVSVQKLKNHAFMGVTLCLKNLFGLTPQEPFGRARQYFHHLVRMPYVLADLGLIYQPALNILDALVSQAGEEWGDGPPRITNTLIAGDNVVATDACAARLMGHDPEADWPTPPFHRDRNALLVAAEAGLGPVRAQEIDLASEVTGPLGDYFAKQTDTLERVAQWRKSMAEQALYYRDHQHSFVARHAGEYILLQQGEVRWHSANSDLRASRRDLSGGSPHQGMWLKYVDPDEQEGEHYQVYEQALASASGILSAS